MRKTFSFPFHLRATEFELGFSVGCLLFGNPYKGQKGDIYGKENEFKRNGQRIRNRQRTYTRILIPRPGSDQRATGRRLHALAGKAYQPAQGHWRRVACVGGIVARDASLPFPRGW